MFDFIASYFTWWQLALMLGVANSGFFLVNQHFKQPARVLMVYRGFGPALLLSPLLFFYDMPTNPVFYYALIASGIIVAWTDRLTQHASSEHGAGVTSRLIPLGVVVVFFYWFISSSSYRAEMLEEPVKLGLIFFAVVAIALALLSMRKDKLSVAALKTLAPCLTIGALIDVLNKVAMNSDEVTAALISYPIIQGLSVGFTTLAWGALTKKTFTKEDVFNPMALKAGGLLCVVVLIASLFKNAAMIHTPNPAYVVALSMSSPIIVMLFNKLRKIPDTASFRSGLIFIFAAIVIVLQS